MRDRDHDEDVSAPEPAPTPRDDRVPDAGAEDDLIIVRDLGDEYALDPSPDPAPPVFSPPPEPEPEPEPEGVDEDAAAGAEDPPPADPERHRRASETIAVDWDREMRPDSSFRRPAPRVTRTPAGAPASLRLAAEKGPAPSRPEPKRPPVDRALTIAALAGAVTFAAATILVAVRVEPFATWYYLFAWYPFLLALNWGSARRSPEHSVFRSRARPVLLLFLWSVPVWLFFEIWNFRLQNWYYVGVPADLVGRRIGVVVSFATVLPGIFFLQEWLTVHRVFAGLRSRPFRLTRGMTDIFLVSGAVFGLLLLWLPDVFFPLVWGVPVLFLEPWLWRAPGPSLMRDLSEGRPGRVLRLLVAGLGCGLFWEAMNFFAGGKWIYTVPGFTTSKLFEMPFAGFVGFAPFALCCWVMARALVRLGLLPEWEIRSARQSVKEALARDTGQLRARGRAGAIVATVVVSAATLSLMDRLTVDSFVPHPENIPGIPDGIVEYAREHGKGDVRGVIALAEAGEFYVPGESSERAIERLAQQARLVLLRGIGTENARRLGLVGVRSVEDLAAQDPDRLTAALGELDEPGWWPRERRVAVWVAAARRATE